MRRIYGEVILEIQSSEPESFANLCLLNGIKLKNVGRTASDKISVQMKALDFFKLPPIVRGKGFKIHIVKKTGYTRKILPMFKRPVFILGFFIAIFLLKLLSSYIWTVKISYNGGDDRIILLKLEEFGLYPGARVSGVDAGLLKEQMILAIDELSWVGIFIEGSSARITYELKTPSPEIIPLDEPCSIYAAKTGILTKLNVFKGHTVAEIGTTVKQGDLLVSSFVPIGEEDYILAHSMAEVEARTWYEIEGMCTSTVKKKKYTGNVLTKKYLYFGNKRIKLSQDYGKIYTNYDIIRSVRRFGENLPFYIVTEKYAQYETVEIALDSEFEEVRLKKALSDTISSGLKEGKIIAAKYTTRREESMFCVKIYCECKEDIGITVKYEER